MEKIVIIKMLLLKYSYIFVDMFVSKGGLI